MMPSTVELRRLGSSLLLAATWIGVVSIGAVWIVGAAEAEEVADRPGVRETAVRPQYMPKLREDRGEWVRDRGRQADEAQGVETAAKRFEEAAAEYRGEVRALLKGDVAGRTGNINQAYNKRIDDLDAEQRTLREEAIARLERFIKMHNDHPRYTPDAMFRLAELYYEKGQSDYAVQMDDYDKQVTLYKRGKREEMPPEPVKNFSRAIALYTEILRRWPKYEFADAAQYLKGYCESEVPDLDAAIKSFEDLGKLFPTSKYVAEAWLRIGEIYFERSDFANAVEAYKRAAATKDPRFYPLALYKLGWAYFQWYKYPEAVATFRTLIEHYDDPAMKAKEKEKAAGAKGADLRKEAVEYLAKSLAEPDWNGDNCPDYGDADVKPGSPCMRPDLFKQCSADQVAKDKDCSLRLRANLYVDRSLKELGLDAKDIAKGGKKAYEREVLVVYGETLYNQAKRESYYQAAKVLAYVVAKYPDADDAPFLAMKVIEAYDSLEDVGNQTAERDKFLALFGRKSKWYLAHQKDEAAIRKVDIALGRIGGDFATLVHRNAQVLRAAGNEDAALKEYARAVIAYEQLLKENPNHPEGYEMTWNLAEALFYSNQKFKSAIYYAAVRDWDWKKKTKPPKWTDHSEEAGFSALKGIEWEIDRRIAMKEGADKLEKRADPKELPSDEEDTPKIEKGKAAEIVRVKPQPIPEVTKQWVVEADKYVDMGLRNEQKPDRPEKLSLQSARVFYKYKDFEEARRRFILIMKKYPKATVAVEAAKDLLTSYRIENDMDNLQIWAKYVEDNELGSKKELEEIRRDLTVVKLGAMFRKAQAVEAEAEAAKKTGDKLVAKEKFAVCSKEYERFIGETKDPWDAAIATLKSGNCAKEAGEFDRALKLFYEGEKRVTAAEPPSEATAKDKNLKSKIITSVIADIASLEYRFFNIDKAIDAYLILYKRDPKSDVAAIALYRAADLAYAIADWGRAASLFEKYANQYQDDKKNKDDAKRALWLVQMAYERAENTPEQLRVLDLYIRRYRDDRSASQRVFEAYDKISDVHAQRDTKRATAAWKENIRAFKEAYPDYIEKRRAAMKPPEAGAKAPPMPDFRPEATVAAKAQFKLYEPRFQAIMEFKFVMPKGKFNAKVLQKQIKTFYDEANGLYNEYMEVVTNYGSRDWSYAAFLRRGQILQAFARALYAAPMPPQFNDEEKGMYTEQIEGFARPIEDQAIKDFEIALKDAVANGVLNEWVTALRKAINQYKPAEYPLLKEQKNAPNFPDGTLPAPETELR